MMRPTYQFTGIVRIDRCTSPRNWNGPIWPFQLRGLVHRSILTIRV